MKSSSSPEIKLQPGECIDYFMDGRLQVIQSKDGYRFSIDAIFLSDFVTVKPGDVVVDLGTGCGVIPLILLITRPVGYTLGLEIQEELAGQAARNALLNGFEEKMGVLLGDIKNPPIAEKSADVVVCNPPYRQMKSGRINPDQRRAIAKHEIMISLNDILYTAKSVLRKKGRLSMIYPSNRLADAVVRMRRFNLEPKKIQINYPTMESSAKLALVEATIGGRPGLEIVPPLIGQGKWQDSEFAVHAVQEKNKE